MKVFELKAHLDGLPDEMEVILQKDSEGNGYELLRAVDSHGIFQPHDDGDNVAYDSRWTADDACCDKEEWKEILKKPRSVILSP